MRVHVVAFPVVLLCLAACDRPAPSAASGDTPLAITHVTVIDVAATDAEVARRTGQTVVIVGGEIRDVAPDSSATIPAGAAVIDGSGKFLIPGLWDAHAHLTYGGRGAMEVLVANGVTGARDLGGRFDELQRLRADVKSGQLAGPLIVAAGPNVEGAWWLDAVTQMASSDSLLRQFRFLERSPRLRLGSPADAAAIVDSVRKLGADLLKFRNVQGDEFRALAGAARRAGLPLTGHAPRGVSIAEAADSGMQSIEHMETVMLSLGDAADSARRAQFAAVAKAGAAITPTLIADVAYRQTPDSVAYAAVADSAGALDPRRRSLGAELVTMWKFGLDIKRLEGPGGDWAGSHREQLADLKRARDAGVTLLVGTDVGVSLVYPGYAVHDELRLLVEEGGLTPLEALRAATINPARIFGLGATAGVVAPGRRADLVLLTADPLADVRNTTRIDAVVLGGKAFARQALDSLVADAERLAKAPAVP